MASSNSPFRPVPGFPADGKPVEGTNGLFRVYRAFTLVNERGDRKDLVTTLKGDPSVKHPCSVCNTDHRFQARDTSVLALVHAAEVEAASVEAPAIGEEPPTEREVAEQAVSLEATASALKTLSPDALEALGFQRIEG